MSKSRHVPAVDAAPRARGGVFRRADGRARGGWLLALSLAVYGAATLGVRLGLGAALEALFRAWNVNAETASLAPGWARTLYAWHGSAVTAASALAVIAVARVLKRRFGLPGNADGPRAALLPALAGLGAALASAAVFLLSDSLRLEWPLVRPNLTAGLLPLAAISFLSVLAGELFGKGVVYELGRARWGRPWAALCAVALFFLTSWSPTDGLVSAANVLLLGAVTCAVYARRGLWAAVGLRWGWSAANLLLLGSGGGDSAVYRLYGVSEHALTGGDAGLMFGLWTTILLAVALLALELNGLRRIARSILIRKR